MQALSLHTAHSRDATLAVNSPLINATLSVVSPRGSIILNQNLRYIPDTARF